jgi:hypothetical protein
MRFLAFPDCLLKSHPQRSGDSFLGSMSGEAQPDANQLGKGSGMLKNSECDEQQGQARGKSSYNHGEQRSLLNPKECM